MRRAAIFVYVHVDWVYIVLVRMPGCSGRWVAIEPALTKLLEWSIALLGDDDCEKVPSYHRDFESFIISLEATQRSRETSSLARTATTTCRCIACLDTGGAQHANRVPHAARCSEIRSFFSQSNKTQPKHMHQNKRIDIGVIAHPAHDCAYPLNYAQTLSAAPTKILHAHNFAIARQLGLAPP